VSTSEPPHAELGQELVVIIIVTLTLLCRYAEARAKHSPRPVSRACRHAVQHSFAELFLGESLRPQQRLVGLVVGQHAFDSSAGVAQPLCDYGLPYRLRHVVVGQVLRQRHELLLLAHWAIVIRRQLCQVAAAISAVVATVVVVPVLRRRRILLARPTPRNIPLENRVF
jgi:hypothetical protein